MDCFVVRWILIGLGELDQQTLGSVSLGLESDPVLAAAVFTDKNGLLPSDETEPRGVQTLDTLTSGFLLRGREASSSDWQESALTGGVEAA